MEIVIIGCRSLDRVGGIESYMLELCSCLVKKGHVVKLFVGNDCNKIEKINGIDVINIKVPQNKYINKLIIGYKSTKLAMKLYPNADIYHFNANVAGLFSVKLLRKHKNVVFQGHGFEWKRAKWNPLIRYCNKKLDNYVLKHNPNILMCSQEQVEYVEKNFKNKNIMFAPGRVCYPPLSPKHDIFKDNNNGYFLFLGRIVAEKRVDLLLKAYSEIENRIDKDLFIVGPVEDESIVENYRNDKRIKFLGPRMGDEKYSLLQNCFAYVIPSDLEGLSISLLEAMSYGKMCIASDIVANKEALADAGLYFPAGNYIELKKRLLEIIENERDFALYQQKAKSRIERTFVWDIITEKIISYYEKIIQQRR